MEDFISAWNKYVLDWITPSAFSVDNPKVLLSGNPTNLTSSWLICSADKVWQQKRFCKNRWTNHNRLSDMRRDDDDDNVEECRSGIFKDKDGCRICRAVYRVFSLKEEIITALKAWEERSRISVTQSCVTMLLLWLVVCRSNCIQGLRQLEIE